MLTSKQVLRYPRECVKFYDINDGLAIYANVNLKLACNSSLFGLPCHKGVVPLFG